MDGLTPLLDKRKRRQEKSEDSVITSQPMEMTTLNFNQNNSRKKRSKKVQNTKKSKSKRRDDDDQEGFSSSSLVSNAKSTSSLDESYFEYLREKKKRKKKKKPHEFAESSNNATASDLDLDLGSLAGSQSSNGTNFNESKPSKTKSRDEGESSSETTSSPDSLSRTASGEHAGRTMPKQPKTPKSERKQSGSETASDSTTSKTSPDASTTGSPSSKSESSTDSEKTKRAKEKDRKQKKKQGKFGRFFAHLCKSGADESILLRAVLWFPIGCVISLILYFLIIRKMNMEEKNKAVIGAGVGAVLAVFFAFSTQVRCALSLVLPSFMGKAGRSYITAFAIIYLIDGPITNMIGNTKEIVRSMTCTSELMSNHTKAKWALRLKPIKNALADLTKDNFQLNRVARGIKKAFSPLRREILKNMVEEQKLKAEINQVERIKEKERKDKNPKEERDQETVRNIERAHRNDENTKDRGKVIEKEWKKKLDLRCQDIFSKGVLRCREKMKKLYRKCRRSIKLVGRFLCLPLKITIFCNIVKIIPKALGVTCKDLDIVRPGFGDTFISAQAVVDNVDQGMKVKMQYRLAGDPNGMDYSAMEEVRAATMHEVEERSEFIKLCFSLVSYVLTFTFLIVFKSAFNYTKHYLTELEYDNVYITKYFKHIDARRRDAGKDTLIPLRKFEKKDIIDPMKIRLSKDEKGQISKGTGRLILRVIIAAVICYMDSILCQVLNIIARKSRVEYHQEGKHLIKIEVYGKGFMGALVRTLLLRFNTNHTLDDVTSNHHCLPDPEETDNLIIGFIFVTYFLVWVFMYFESFGLRMRHVIAGFFYRKLEKKRVLHLYNEMFRRRIGYLARLRKVVRKGIRRRTYKKETGLIVLLQRQYPKYFGWLRIFKSKKENCIICEDPQDEDFHLCPTKGCGLAYCAQCWMDVKKKCLACKSRGEESDESDSEEKEKEEEDSDDDDDDDDYDTDTSDQSASE